MLGLFYDDSAFRSAYEECPASTMGHHARLGGLLQHTVEVATIGRAVALTSGADRELVLAGAMLHDVGKLEAYAWRGGIFELTEAAALLGHVALGMPTLDRRLAREATPLLQPRVLLLQHLVASHHGMLEHGAPVRPMTLEAEVLHYADDASAKTSSMAEVLTSPSTSSNRSRSSTDRSGRRIIAGCSAGRSEWGERDAEAMCGRR